MTPYSNACKKLISNFIGRSTRFGTQDLIFNAENARTIAFSVEIQYQLHVKSEYKTIAGLVPASQHDFISSDWSWYQQEVQEQANHELNRQQTRAELIKSVASRRYAAIDSQVCLRTHPRRLLHPHTCGTCSGNGKICCHSCSGCGKVDCSVCYGRGKQQCGHCHGSGQTSETRQVRDCNGHYRMETQYRHCIHCNGGKVRCNYCCGDGKQTCSNCHGSGRLTCSSCIGHGQLTRITSTHTYTQPSFSGIYPKERPAWFHAALSKLGFASLSQHADVSFQRFEELGQLPGVNFYYSCQIPVNDMSVQVLGHASRCALLGKTPQLHDAGGILEKLLDYDQRQLRALLQSPAMAQPWFRRRARPVISQVMASEVHQAMIRYDAAKQSAETIVENISRSVSADYVRQLLKDMNTAHSQIAFWSGLKYLLTMIILAPLVALSAALYQNRGQAHTMWDHELVRFTDMCDQLEEILIPVTIFCWFILLLHRWRQRRWLRKIGGEPLLQWAKKKGHITSIFALILACGSANYMSNKLFTHYPVWFDQQGKIYGVLPFYQPKVIAPFAVSAPVSVSKKTHKKKRKPPTVAKAPAAPIAPDQDNPYPPEQ